MILWAAAMTTGKRTREDVVARRPPRQRKLASLQDTEEGNGSGVEWICCKSCMLFSGYNRINKAKRELDLDLDLTGGSRVGR